jgi:hypothetical protein
MLARYARSSSRTIRPHYIKSHRNIATGERPAIIHERLQAMASETEAKTEIRMGWLKLGTMWFVGFAGGYCVLFQDFKDSDGNDYEHCFQPIRRVFHQGLDSVLGVSSSTASSPAAAAANDPPQPVEPDGKA